MCADDVVGYSLELNEVRTAIHYESIHNARWSNLLLSIK
jgi:hypothetical protein